MVYDDVITPSKVHVRRSHAVDNLGRSRVRAPNERYVKITVLTINTESLVSHP